LSLDTGQAMRPGTVTLSARLALTLLQSRQQLRRMDAPTLVLRSTHSSQLSVGLLRFCFFLGGASPWFALAEGSGLVEGCVPW
jgi:hypothetical protein